MTSTRPAASSSSPTHQLHHEQQLQQQKRIFPEIQGFRTLLNFWVVLCHTANVLQHFAYIQAANNPQDTFLLHYVLHQPWLSVCNAFGFQVDIFFVISGFVLTYSMLCRADLPTAASTAPPLSASSFLSTAVKTCPGCFFMLCKKLLRYYPAMLASLLLAIWMKDFATKNVWDMLTLFVFPLKPAVPVSFVTLWSNRIDILCSIWLYMATTGLQYWSCVTLPMAMLLVLASFLPKCWRFFAFTPHISYLQMNRYSRLADRLIPVSMSPDRTRYYRDVLYPDTFDVLPIEPIGGMKRLIIEKEYTVFHQRITPFFIGLALAVVMKQAWGQETVHAKTATHPMRRFAYQLFHGMCLFLSMFIAMQPYLVTLTNKIDLERLQQQEEMPLSSLPTVPIVADFFISAAIRPLFAAAFAYLLCRSMLPPHHELHLPSLSSFLCWKPLQWLSKYTYSIHVIHMKILHEVMWKYFPPKMMNRCFGKEHVAGQFIIWVTATYSCSLLFAILIYHTLEIPSNKRIREPLIWLEGRLLQNYSPKKTI